MWIEWRVTSFQLNSYDSGKYQIITIKLKEMEEIQERVFTQWGKTTDNGPF